MEHTELRATEAMLPIYKDHIDITAHEFAEATADAWYYTPLQTKDGFGRTVEIFGSLVIGYFRIFICRPLCSGSKTVIFWTRHRT